MDEDDVLRAQIFSMVHDSDEEQSPPSLKDNFLYFVAEAIEIDKEMLEKYWGFLNKDVSTTNISEKQIEELRMLATAVYLEEYETIPRSELTEEMNRKFWNLDVAVMTRARKSLSGFLIKRATEKHLFFNKEEDKKKRLW
ncbi:hypothetical protein [Methanocaldococcus sp.]